MSKIKGDKCRAADKCFSEDRKLWAIAKAEGILKAEMNKLKICFLFVE